MVRAFPAQAPQAMANHLFDLVRIQATDLAKTFIETESGTVYSYGDLFDATGRLANVLVSLGVKPGDRVAVQVEKSPSAIFLYLACVRAGAIFLPLNTAYTLTELEYFLGDSEPALVVCDPSRRDGIAAIAAKTGVGAVATLGKANDGSLMEMASAASAGFETVDRAAGDLAAILYTSGTTGRSKGAMLSHDNLASNALTLKDYWRFTSNDVLLHALPIFHTHGLFVATNTILMAGASMIFLPKFDADTVFDLMPRATCMMGVPTFYVRLVQDARLTRSSTAHMRLFISGSAPLLAETHRLFRDKTGVAILERYGMTETNMNTSNPYEGERVAGTVGFPLPGVSLRVADPDTGAELAQGEIGVIEVKGPNVFGGYWRMPEKTAAEFRGDGFFITGDLGKIDDRGYVHIVGPRQGSRDFRRLQRLPEGSRDRDRRHGGRGGERRHRRGPSRFRRGRDGCRGGREGRQDRRARDPDRTGDAACQVQAAEAGDRGRRPCRATRWARCRRTCCATPTRISTRPDRHRRAGYQPLAACRSRTRSTKVPAAPR